MLPELFLLKARDIYVALVGVVESVGLDGDAGIAQILPIESAGVVNFLRLDRVVHSQRFSTVLIQIFYALSLH